jgi:hypothetical protein
MLHVVADTEASFTVKQWAAWALLYVYGLSYITRTRLSAVLAHHPPSASAQASAWGPLLALPLLRRGQLGLLPRPPSAWAGRV